ncbi:hypothetical protein LPJ64_004338 [Coemansia asiatica]|uniref:Ubiquitin-like domain-containing protein n=1 Tax=Coemansia asiatica TaxID=1052880 RepID=A0A9W7XJ37_9FUNG|nr:hypothetical protein LPJ64_004338 [Coemansia asiatica]
MTTNEIRGNPFETNVLVKYETNSKVQKSYFIHELPPNCSIEHLRERIEQVGVPFDDWEIVFKHNSTRKQSKKVVLLNNKETFEDYGIKCWDSVYVVPRAECHTETGAHQKLLTRIGGNIASTLGIWTRRRSSASIAATLKSREKPRTGIAGAVSDSSSGYARSSTLKEQTPYMDIINKSTNSIGSAITSLSIFQPEDDIKSS